MACRKGSPGCLMTTASLGGRTGLPYLGNGVMSGPVAGTPRGRGGESETNYLQGSRD